MSDICVRLFSLAGKTALVTGASGGIGRALAVGLAEAGATVGLNGRSLDKLQPVCHAIEEAGAKAMILAADLTDVNDCRRLIAEAYARLGRIDVLVNCAGINRRKPIEAVTEDDYEAIMMVDLRSSFFLCQAVYPIMRKQGGGKIINIGSLNSVYGLDTIAVYGAAKAGLAQITRVMAVEWARDNIQVNSIMPGFIMTPLTEQALWQEERRDRWLRARIPARRPGLPEELVGATLLLASNASSYMTGTTVTVDGGFLAGGSWDQDAV